MNRVFPTLARRRELIFGGAAVGVMIVAGRAIAQASPREHVVTMSDMSYGRIPSDLKVGDTITWVNRDTVVHTVTARDRSFDLRVAPGQSVRMHLDKAGAVPFFCVLHTAMRGTLSVSAK